MNKKVIITTVFDELLNSIEMMGLHTFDRKAFDNGIIRAKYDLIDRKFGITEILITNDDFLQSISKKMQEENSLITPDVKLKYLRSFLQKGLFLSSQDIIIYRILLSNYINNQKDGYATITLDEIHNVYRGKAFMYKNGMEKYDAKTLAAYRNSFYKLSTMKIQIKFLDSNMKQFKEYQQKGKHFFMHNMVKFDSDILIKTSIPSSIKYSLGDLGECLRKASRYGQLVPFDTYKLRFNQIDIFNMTIYICRMIFINRKRRKEFKIYVFTLLSKIMKYQQNGLSMGITYLKYLETEKPVERSKKIRQLEKQIISIMDLLVKENKIKEYSIVGKFNYSFIKAKELSINIVFNKRG